MTVTDAAVSPAGRLAQPTGLEIRPRYEGSNICTWIGFKHVNYLVEEAVLEHLRRRGAPAGELYERYGLCVDIADIDTRILHAFHIDDLAIGDVRPLERSAADELAFAVKLHRQADPDNIAVSAKVRVVLRHDPRGGAAEDVPAHLAPFTAAHAGLPAPHPVPEVRVGDGDPVAALGGGNAFVWKWRMPYFYCHFTERVQMSGYLRLMEEVVDLFLADRGVSIKRLLDEQDWIPVVPHSRVTLLDEARMEEDLYTVFTVENVFKRFTYTARMDCYALRDGVLVPTATGRITHGYAVIENRRDWHLISFDDRLTTALEGGSGHGSGRTEGRG